MLATIARRGLFAALFVAACSSGGGEDAGDAADSTRPGADDEPGASAANDGRGEGAAANKDVCATLDYGHTRANADYFRVFADDAAAFAYSRDFLAYSAMPEGIEVSHDARLTRLLDRVYAGMRAVFPKETDGLESPPRVVLVRADGVNAFAGYDERPSENKAPWIVWVHDATLTTPTPDEQVAGLLAHELAHLLLRNLLPETRAKIRTHYRVPGRAEHGVIGAVMPDDPKVRAHVEEIRAAAARVGRYAAFGPLPISTYQDSDYEELLATLATTKERSPDSAACDAADRGISRARALLASKVSIHNSALYLTREERDELASLVPSTAQSLERCYAHVKMPLFELWVRDRVGRSSDLSSEARDALVTKALDPSTTEHAVLYAGLTEAERRADEGGERPTIARFLEVVDTLHQRIRALESDPSLPIEELRVFDLEEDADDAAVRILRHVGDDPLANAQLYVDMMPNAAECRRAIDDGNVPAYGRFVDEHNATCWRLFHSRELDAVLARCPKGPPRAAKANASPSRPPPRELLEPLRRAPPGRILIDHRSPRR